VDRDVGQNIAQRGGVVVMLLATNPTKSKSQNVCE